MAEVTTQVASPPSAAAEPQPDPVPAVEPKTFTVKATDNATGKEMDLVVTRNLRIQSQQDAEEHVANMPKSIGGTHRGFKVTPKPVPAAPAVAATTDPATE